MKGRWTKKSVYRISGMFCVGKFWRKCRLEGVLNFHRVIFLLFQGLSTKTYSRVYFSLCLFLAISGRSRPQRKLNPREKFSIYGMSLWFTANTHTNLISYDPDTIAVTIVGHWRWIPGQFDSVAIDDLLHLKVARRIGPTINSRPIRDRGIVVG